MEGMFGGLYTFIVVTSSMNAAIHCSDSMLEDVATTPFGTSDRAYMAIPRLG